MTDIIKQLRELSASEEIADEAADEITRLRSMLQNGSPIVEGTIQHMAMRISELEAVIKSHGIPVKSMSGGVAHYCMGEKK